MSPSFTHLKSLSAKIDAKLGKVKCNMRKTKSTADQTETITQLAPNEQETRETMATSEPDHSGEEGHELVQHTSCGSPTKQEKAAKRQERREARKAKWAARRASFKTKSKKVAEALFLPTAVVLGIIFSPVILAVDAVICIFRGVVWLVVMIGNLMCVPIVVCFARE